MISLPSAWGCVLRPAPASITPKRLRITDRQGRLLYEMLPQMAAHNRYPLEKIRCTCSKPPCYEDSHFYTIPAWIWRHPALLVDRLRGGEAIAGAARSPSRCYAPCSWMPKSARTHPPAQAARELVAWKTDPALLEKRYPHALPDQTYYGACPTGRNRAKLFSVNGGGTRPGRMRPAAGLPRRRQLQTPSQSRAARPAKKCVGIDGKARQ